jgi:transposase
MTIETTAALGIDISKKDFDVALLRSEKFKNKKFANNPKGFSALVNWLEGLGVNTRQVRVCMEATGGYGEPLGTIGDTHNLRL